MRIVIVSSNYLPFTGGVETHAQQVSEVLSKKHDISIAAMNFTACKLPFAFRVLHDNLLAPTEDSRTDGEVRVHSISPRMVDRVVMLPMLGRIIPKLRSWYHHPINRITHPFYRFAIVPKLRRIFRGADVVHSLAFGDLGWASEKAARMGGCKFVCTPFAHPGQWGCGPNDVSYYNRCDAVIGLVESDCAHLRSIGVDSSRIHTIGVSPNLPSHVDGARFRQKHALGDAPLFVYIGRMMAQKGATAVVQSARKVWESLPDARFVFIGPAVGSESNIFDGIDPRILYLGRVDAQEKGDALAACDVFIMPSMSEILPTVYLEAWLLSKPVVGGLAPGLRELIEGNGAGKNVSQDPEQIAALLLQLIRDKAQCEKMGNAGKELVNRLYTTEAVASQLESLYSRMVEEGLD